MPPSRGTANARWLVERHGFRTPSQVRAAEPALIVPSGRLLRYDAACSSALAAAGMGVDAPNQDDPARASLRGQALAWLRAELIDAQKAFASDDIPARTSAVRQRRLWKIDPDLTGVREPAALEKLPEAERAEWRVVWADVVRLLATVDSGNP
jgi:serine/threonine-protein kinase